MAKRRRRRSKPKPVVLPPCVLILRKRRDPDLPLWPKRDFLVMDEYGDLMRHIVSFCILVEPWEDATVLRVWRLDPSKPRPQPGYKNVIEDNYGLIDILRFSDKKFDEAQFDLLG